MFTKNQARTFQFAGLKDATGHYVNEPTLAIGDVKVSKDHGAFSNIGTLPTTLAGESELEVVLTADELNCDTLIIKFTDVSGAEWVQTKLQIDTSTIGTTVATILDDTNELQSNQGDWATATGFSTHTATSVWQVDSAQLWTSDSFGLEFLAILADTNELQTNQNNWLTATGLTVTLSNPVIDESTIELDAGDTYDGTRRPKLTWTVTKDYTGATVELLIWRDNEDKTQTTMKTATGVVDSATQLSVSMTATFDAALDLTGGCPLFEKLRFALVVTESSNEETVAKGDCYVYERP